MARLLIVLFLCISFACEASMGSEPEGRPKTRVFLSFDGLESKDKYKKETPVATQMLPLKAPKTETEAYVQATYCHVVGDAAGFRALVRGNANFSWHDASPDSRLANSLIDIFLSHPMTRRINEDKGATFPREFRPVRELAQQLEVERDADKFAEQLALFGFEWGVVYALMTKEVAYRFWNFKASRKDMLRIMAPDAFFYAKRGSTKAVERLIQYLRYREDESKRPSWYKIPAEVVVREVGLSDRAVQCILHQCSHQSDGHRRYFINYYAQQGFPAAIEYLFARLPEADRAKSLQSYLAVGHSGAVRAHLRLLSQARGWKDFTKKKQPVYISAVEGYLASPNFAFVAAAIEETVELYASYNKLDRAYDFLIRNVFERPAMKRVKERFLVANDLYGLNGEKSPVATVANDIWQKGVYFF